MHPLPLFRSFAPSVPALAFSLLFVFGFLLDVSQGIKCYECDEFPGGASNMKCPGGSLITYGSKSDVRIYLGTTPCKHEQDSI